MEGAKAKWLKNEETIFESSKYMISQRDNVFSLRIRDGQKSDEACYTVSLTNHRGEQAKCSASAKVTGNCHHFIFSSSTDEVAVGVIDVVVLSQTSRWDSTNVLSPWL